MVDETDCSSLWRAADNDSQAEALGVAEGIAKLPLYGESVIFNLLRLVAGIGSMRLFSWPRVSPPR
jgi:hypothetical protein